MNEPTEMALEKAISFGVVFSEVSSLISKIARR